MQLSIMDRSARRARRTRKTPAACALVIGLLAGCTPMPVQDPQGAAGAQRIFGDSSAGDRTVAASTTLADTNLQYANFTVNPDVTLTIPSGAVIRCTGTFTNNGTITVQTGAVGSIQTRSTNDTQLVSYVPSEAGIALSPSGSGEFGANLAPRAAGVGGLGLRAFEARSELNPGVKAGGGGGGSFNSRGSSGGGSLTVLAQTALLNAASGTITAAGAGVTLGGIGGGGGGVIILASPGSVVNNGTISANGGAGGGNNSSTGAGGGGGGGIIHMLSPTLTAGTTSVTGGVAGAEGGPGSVTSGPPQGGGGGGACGGNGGNGSQLSAGTPSGATAGLPGHVLQSTVNPTALF